jgi:hypothetical protein
MVKMSSRVCTKSDTCAQQASVGWSVHRLDEETIAQEDATMTTTNSSKDRAPGLTRRPAATRTGRTTRSTCRQGVLVRRRWTSARRRSRCCASERPISWQPPFEDHLLPVARRLRLLGDHHAPAPGGGHQAADGLPVRAGHPDGQPAGRAGRVRAVDHRDGPAPARQAAPADVLGVHPEADAPHRGPDQRQRHQGRGQPDREGQGLAGRLGRLRGRVRRRCCRCTTSTT